MTDKYITVSDIKDALHNSIGILLKRRMNDYVPNDMIPQRVTHRGGKSKKKKKTEEKTVFLYLNCEGKSRKQQLGKDTEAKQQQILPSDCCLFI